MLPPLVHGATGVWGLPSNPSFSHRPPWRAAPVWDHTTTTVTTTVMLPPSVRVVRWLLSPVCTNVYCGQFDFQLIALWRIVINVINFQIPKERNIELNRWPWLIVMYLNLTYIAPRSFSCENFLAYFEYVKWFWKNSVKYLICTIVEILGM